MEYEHIVVGVDISSEVENSADRSVAVVEVVESVKGEIGDDRIVTILLEWETIEDETEFSRG